MGKQHKNKFNPVSKQGLDGLRRNKRQDPGMEIGAIGKSNRKNKPHSEVPSSNHLGIDRGRWAD